MKIDLPPLRFRPVLKQTIWGGRRLGESLGKPIGDGSDYAESWEVVDHGDDQSVVDGGPHDGMTLSALLSQYRQQLIGPGGLEQRFPLLLKYLDCNRVLSVQVHPDDSYAGQMDSPDLGKTEAWYIVESTDDAVIYAGLREGVDRESLGAAIEAGQTEQVLHQFHPSAGDVVFIPAGTVHALGGGLLVAEIQQSSDTTFRLFDWNRTDADGNARPLHLQQGLDVTDYDRGPIEPTRADETADGVQTLVQCDKFTLSAIHNGTAAVGDHDRFEILTVPKGSATITVGEDQQTLRTGETILWPAACEPGKVDVHDSGVVLLMR